MRKTLFCVLMITVLLTACGGRGNSKSAEQQALEIRMEYLSRPGCYGTAEVSVDYGRRVYQFTLQFEQSGEGRTVLTVLAPEELAGLTAVVETGESRLEYQGLSLGTGDLTGEGLTPLEFLPTVMEQVREGYMAECVFETLGETECVRIVFREPDASPQTGLECHLWLERESGGMVRTELFWDGTLVLSSDFTSFTIGEKTDGSEANEDLG